MGGRLAGGVGFLPSVPGGSGTVEGNETIPGVNGKHSKRIWEDANSGKLADKGAGAHVSGCEGRRDKPGELC